MKAVFLFLLLTSMRGICSPSDTLYSFSFGSDVTITIDAPHTFSKKEIIIILYALPNGNTTAQTMGKKMVEGDDWHFDIQHIKAQTDFIRNSLLSKNVVVAYLENEQKSWPSWKKAHENYTKLTNDIVDTIYSIIAGKKKTIYLNGHSGGGSFIFSYLQSQQQLPSFIQRISFLDSNYGYDSSHTAKIVHWLAASRKNHLAVFAYNDSVVIYNGKPLVSPTGGTWYRSKLMQSDLSKHFAFDRNENDSLVKYSARNKRVMFFLKKNDEGKILHTVQVEKNGFIHSILCGTGFEEVGYKYFGDRAYQVYIK